MGGPAPEKEEVKTAVDIGDAYVIDDFESGSLRSPREWWTFNIAKADIDSNANRTGGDEEVAAQVGKYSLILKGDASNWYVGGCGTYIAQEGADLSRFDTLELDVYGNGENSGTLKIELFDDDNNNWQVEQDAAKNYAPTSDDKLVYDLIVDWDGWQRVSIPLDDFVDANAGVGDDIWNPNQESDSGGLLQIQIICLAGSEDGGVNYNLDNIRLTVGEE
jgi:hypothetical protein